MDRYYLARPDRWPLGALLRLLGLCVVRVMDRQTGKQAGWYFDAAVRP